MADSNDKINGEDENVFQTFSKNETNDVSAIKKEDAIVSAFSFKKSIYDEDINCSVSNVVDEMNSCYYYSGKFPEGGVNGNDDVDVGVYICEDKNDYNNNNNNAKETSINPFQYQICTYSTTNNEENDDTKSLLNMIDIKNECNDCSFLTEYTPKYKAKHKKGMSICEYFNNTNTSVNKSTSFSNLCKGINLSTTNTNKSNVKCKANTRSSNKYNELSYVKQKKKKVLKSSEDIELERINKEIQALKMFQNKHRLQYEKYYKSPCKINNTNQSFLNKKRTNSNNNDILLLTQQLNAISIKTPSKHKQSDCKENNSLLSNNISYSNHTNTNTFTKRKCPFNSIHNSTQSFKTAFSKQQCLRTPCVWNTNNNIKKQNIIPYDKIVSQNKKVKYNY